MLGIRLRMARITMPYLTALFERVHAEAAGVGQGDGNVEFEFALELRHLAPRPSVSKRFFLTIPGGNPVLPSG